jgi:hypothetical protein
MRRAWIERERANWTCRMGANSHMATRSQTLPRRAEELPRACRRSARRHCSSSAPRTSALARRRRDGGRSKYRGARFRDGPGTWSSASRKTSTYCSVRRIWCCMQAWSGHTRACLRPIPRGRLQGTWLPATPLKNGSPWSFAFKTYVVPYAPLASCVGLQPIGP